MPITAWTEKRLNHLFQRYNQQYWKGKLPNYVVSITAMEYWGQCVLERHEISIDVSRHKSDAQVRSTLLHEMAHAATGIDKLAHGYEFWAQIEHLLRQGAPIKVSFSEAPSLGLVDDAVPKRFPMARRAMNELERRRQKQLARMQSDGDLEIDDDVVAERFEDAAIARLSWEQAVLLVGGELGLLDVGGRPRNAEAKRMIAKCRKSFLRLSNSLPTRDKFRERMANAP